MTRYYLIHPNKFKLDGGAMYGIIPRPLWSKFSPPDELNRIEMDLRLLLIQSKDRNILIDTGIGSFRGEKWNQRFAVSGQENGLLKGLNELGLTADDISDLVLSHLHFDHVGGLTEGNQIILPNATVHLHKKHYLYSLNPTQRDQGSFESQIYQPVIEELDHQGRVNWLTEDEGEILPELNYKISHGHTPYMIHPFDDNFLYLADLIPTSNHIRIPWVMGYDIAPGITTQYKSKMIQFCIEKKLVGIFEHDPKLWGSKIRKGAKDFEVEEGHQVTGAPLTLEITEQLISS